MGLGKFPSSVPGNPRDWGRVFRETEVTADIVGPSTVDTAMIIDNAVTYAKMQDVAALSVVGRPINSTGDASAISAGSDLTLLRRSGLSVGFGSITSAYISDFNEAAQDAALAALTDSSELDWTYNDGAGTASASLIAGSVANTKLVDMAADTILGRANGAGTGVPQNLSAAQVSAIISNAIASALNIATGVYTPTVTNVTNLDAISATQAQYMRVGTTVVVSGRFTADATAAGALTEFGLSLPISSNIGAREDIGGLGHNHEIAGLTACFSGDSANDRASVRWNPSDAASRIYNYIFMYRVI